MAYTPPTIGLIPFVMGDDAITSPYCDIYHPMSSIDSEVTTVNIINADINHPMSAIDCENKCEIFIGVDLNHPASRIEAVAFNYKLTDTEINHQPSTIDSVVVTTNIINCDIHHPPSRIQSFFGSLTEINHPMSSIDSVVANSIVINCDIYHARSKITADVEGPQASLQMEAPLPDFSLSGSCGTQGEVHFSIPLSRLEIAEEIDEIGVLSMKTPDVFLKLQNPLSFTDDYASYIPGEIR